MPSAIVTPGRPASILDPFLRDSLYIPELRSRKKASALEEMTDRAFAERAVRSREAVLEVLRQREALGSTGIGRGIAIPHGRSTFVTERTVLVARSTRGIEFDAVDRKPVHLCFLILAPPVDQDPIYLQLLAEIVRSVRLARTRGRILQARDFQTVRDVLTHACDESAA